MIAPLPTAFDIVVDDTTGAPGVNPFSARGLKGTLAPIAAAQGIDKLRRTVNGTLISIAAPQMWKYRLDVSGEDVAPAALDGLWVGMQASVDCHVELAFLTAGGAASRPMVPGSDWVDGDYTYYRPQLLMLIVDLQTSRDEWGASVSWSMTLEEV
jgi:hypothetical protein